MVDILFVIAPVFLLIFVGFEIKFHGLLDEGFWQGAERLTYFVLLPALLLGILSDADFGGLDVLPMTAALVSSVVAMAVLLMIARPRLAISGPGFTSLFQGATRQNTYIGLAVAGGVFGPAGQDAAALAVGTVVPVVNLMCVAALARHGSAADPSLTGTLQRIVKNPLILACVLGIALNMAGLSLPPVIDTLVSLLSRGALPLGLLAVGAGLGFAAGRTEWRNLALACALKLAIMPALAALACLVFGAEGAAAAVAVLFCALPAATSSYILARQLGGDAELMARIITLQVAVSFVSLPAVLLLLT